MPIFRAKLYHPKHIKGSKTLWEGRGLNPIDIIAGMIIISAGILTIAGYINLAVIVGGLGFLIEAIKIAIQQGSR